MGAGPETTGVSFGRPTNVRVRKQRHASALCPHSFAIHLFRFFLLTFHALALIVRTVSVAKPAPRWRVYRERHSTIVVAGAMIVRAFPPHLRCITRAGSTSPSKGQQALAVHKSNSYMFAVSSQEDIGTSSVSIDLDKYKWYDRTCPCGLAAGDCKEHPRARASQHPPEGDWTRWFLMAGRGFGKTKAGAEWVRHIAENKLASRIALVGPTAADVRDVMVEGESGILSVSRPDFRPVYLSSLRRLEWGNGVVATCFSADEPERLRGPQHDHAWIDEPGAWRYGQEAFDMLMFGLRLGEHPRVCVTTTPRPTKLIKALAGDPRTHLAKGTTYDNRIHLAPAFFTEIISKYEGTRLGEQEINAQLLEIAEGAWFPMFSMPRAMSRPTPSIILRSASEWRSMPAPRGIRER